jgi:hypothetical protein
MGRPNNEVEITLGDGVAVIRRQNRSTATVAHVLGETSANGAQRIYLDRLVHNGHQVMMGEWVASGAISTILERPLSPE